ncbi:uncharacterized protein LOC132560963 [Ylistrum balloti]|uniref:uncharacterized protein LOC132560963 n=1 Tax=Ylistrum balloti TaxID=509963 RepID=UPI0029057FF2|nr:uncharacterized protein LOC132560963 [Ylistrum balloti]
MIAFETDAEGGWKYRCSCRHTLDVKYDAAHSQADIRRSEILDFGNGGFLLHNILTPTECASIIDGGEKIGFESIHAIRHIYRGSQRITIESQSLADLLWTRVQPYLEELDIPCDSRSQHVHGVVKDKWVPVGVNKSFGLIRYNPIGHFAPQFDWIEQNSEHRSMRTLMVHLNGDFLGGSTNFVGDIETLFTDGTGTCSAREEDSLFTIQPESGMAIIYDHGCLVEGQKPGGDKTYILRTVLMYKRQQGQN